MLAVVVVAEPFWPRPTSSVLASVGSCAKPTISASEPPEPMAAFRLSKCWASVAEQGGPVSAAGFGQDVVDVRFDGGHADDELAGDLLVG